MDTWKEKKKKEPWFSYTCTCNSRMGVLEESLTFSNIQHVRDNSKWGKMVEVSYESFYHHNNSYLLFPY